MLLDTVRSASDYVTDTTYDSAGRMNIRTFGNGTQSDYDYNPWNTQGGRLKTIKSGTGAAPAALQNLTYSYDAGGNITQIANPLASETQAYGYDALDRLTSWTLNNVQQEAYGYNPTTGNLETKAGITYTYDTLHNHQHAVASLTNGNSYLYDANGNQITRTVNNQTFNLAYDAEGHLVTVSGGATANFTYDGDGQMVKAVKNGVTTLCVGAHYEVINPGAAQTVAKYYFAGGARVAMRKYVIPQSMALEYMLGDQLGSTSITTDANGAKVSEMRYKPWGELRYSWSDPSLNTTPTYQLSDYTFTGQRSYTADFGLMFYNARFYDPQVGRFTSADTIVPGGVQGLDRYAYVNNSPVNYTDPSGHESDPYGCNGNWDCLQQHVGSGSSGGGGGGGGGQPKSWWDTIVDSYKLGWTNFGAAWSTLWNPNTSLYGKSEALNYMTAWGGAHVELGAGLAVLAYIAVTYVAAALGACGLSPCREQAVQTAGEVVEVSQSKIGYLLSNSGKASGFTELGYTAETLKSELEGIGQTVSSADFSTVTEWGPRFEKALEVGSSDMAGRINTVWQIDNGTNVLRLITAWVEIFKK